MPRPVLFYRLLFCFFLLSVSEARAQWVQMQGPDGSFTVQLTEVNGAYWACTFNGIFTTPDLNQSWEQHPVFGNFQVVHCVATYGDTVYVCAQEITGNSQGSNLYISADKGESWTSIELNGSLNYPTSFPPSRIFRIGDILFAVSENYLLRSIDFGAYWEVVFYGEFARYEWDEQSILCTTKYGAYVSESAGFTWDQLFSSNFNTFGKPHVKNNYLFVPRSDSIFVSTNSGQTWIAQSTASLPFLVAPALYWEGDGDGLYAAFDNRLYKSQDFGLSWTAIGNTPPSVINKTEPVVSGNTLVLATGMGLFRTDNDGISWKRCDRGMFAAYVSGIHDNGQTLFANTANELFRSQDLAKNWKSLFQCEFPGLYCFSGFGFYQQEVYLIANNRLFYSPDQGEHFNPIADPLIDPMTPAINGRMSGKRFYYLNAAKVMIFENGELKDSLTFGPVAQEGIVDFYDMDGRYLLLPVAKGKVFYSDNKGTNWQPGDSIPSQYGSYFYRIDDRLFLCGEQIHYSDDRGKTWVQASLEVPIPGGFLLSDICRYGNRLFALSNVPSQGYIYYSSDMGATWKRFDTPFSPGQSIGAIHVYGSRLYAGISSSGVWHTGLTVPAHDLPQGETPRTLTITPNPAGNIAAIRWRNPLPGTGLLEVRSMQGQLIRQIGIAPGAGHLELSVSEIPPGIYLIQLQTGQTRLTGSLLRQ